MRLTLPPRLLGQFAPSCAAIGTLTFLCSTNFIQRTVNDRTFAMQLSDLGIAEVFTML